MSKTKDTQRDFFQKSQTFGFGQTNWAEFFEAFGGIFGQTISTIMYCESLVLEKMYLVQLVVLPTKTLFFRPNTYKSQINPKYDMILIGSKTNVTSLKHFNHFEIVILLLLIHCLFLKYCLHDFFLLLLQFTVLPRFHEPRWKAGSRL